MLQLRYGIEPIAALVKNWIHVDVIEAELELFAAHLRHHIFDFVRKSPLLNTDSRQLTILY